MNYISLILSITSCLKLKRETDCDKFSFINNVQLLRIFCNDELWSVGESSPQSRRLVRAGSPVAPHFFFRKAKVSNTSTCLYSTTTIPVQCYEQIPIGTEKELTLVQCSAVQCSTVHVRTHAPVDMFDRSWTIIRIKKDRDFHKISYRYHLHVQHNYITVISNDSIQLLSQQKQHIHNILMCIELYLISNHHIAEWYASPSWYDITMLSTMMFLLCLNYTGNTCTVEFGKNERCAKSLRDLRTNENGLS